MPAQVFRFAALAVALAGAATAQVAILQIQTVEGDGAVHAPGSRSSRPLAVEVTDETGRPVGGAAVSFHLPDEGPSGLFPNGLRTAVATTDVRGRASVSGLQVNRIGGRFQIRIVASKEQARAGIVSFQYVAEPSSGAAHAAASSGHRKWLIVAAVIAGGAAAGALGATRTSESKPAPPPAAPALTIGTPTVVVIKP